MVNIKSSNEQNHIISPDLFNKEYLLYPDIILVKSTNFLQLSFAL